MRRGAKSVLAAVVGLALAAVASVTDAFWMRPGPSEPPALAGEYRNQWLRHEGHARRYGLYRPASLPPGAPLLVVLHGPISDGEGMRALTAYRFDQWAEQHGWLVAYPTARHRRWNDCRAGGAPPGTGAPADDVGFLRGVVAEVVREHGADPDQVHVVGYSGGGQMALRMALQAPDLLASSVMVGTGVPEGGDNACGPVPADAPRMLLVNGTADALNPYHGGTAEPGDGRQSQVMSARASALWLMGLDADAQPPAARDDARRGISHEHWRSAQREVGLLTVHGGGHTLPQPYVRYPRRLGPTYARFDGIEAIARFVGASRQATAGTAAGTAAGCRSC